MAEPLVSILMPVYNSTDFSRGNGNLLLPLALESLLAQTLRDFELIILDNQSTDQTPDICRQYAEKDKRIHFIVDTQKRFPEGAVTHLGSYARGKYCVAANDDDLWAPTFLETTIAYLEVHPECDMAYTNSYLIDVAGKRLGKPMVSVKNAYTDQNPLVFNFSSYLQKRNVLPIIFGVFRTEIFLNLLPYDTFDELKANVDNLFLLKFFIRGHRCHFIDMPLFFYRHKVRPLNTEDYGEKEKRLPKDMPTPREPLAVWLYYVRHQLDFANRIACYIDASKSSELQSAYLRLCNVQAFLKHSLDLLDWLARDYAPLASLEIRDEFAKLELQIKRRFGEYTETTLMLGSLECRFPDYYPFYIFEGERRARADLSEFSEILQKHSQSRTLEAHSAFIFDLHKKLGAWLAELVESGRSHIVPIGTRPEILRSTGTAPVLLGSSPRVSVISPSFNTGSFLEETIRTLLCQGFQSWEHIVVDNDSEDETGKILAKYPHLRVIREKDSGFHEAFVKGLKDARGEFIFSCCISDGYLDVEWIEKCVKVMDSMPDVSLVWGLPQYLNEDGLLGGVSYEEFQKRLPPQKEGFFYHWLKTGFWLPEGNFCVRRRVMEQCLPPWPIPGVSEYDMWLEFSYNFHLSGYLPFFLGQVANFGRRHTGQSGQREVQSGQMKERMNRYTTQVNEYRKAVLKGTVQHRFRDGKGEIIESIASSDIRRRARSNMRAPIPARAWQALLPWIKRCVPAKARRLIRIARDKYMSPVNSD